MTEFSCLRELSLYGKMAAGARSANVSSENQHCSPQWFPFVTINMAGDRIYFVHMLCGGQTKTKKIVIFRVTLKGSSRFPNKSTHGTPNIWCIALICYWMRHGIFQHRTAPMQPEIQTQSHLWRRVWNWHSAVGSETSPLLTWTRLICTDTTSPTPPTPSPPTHTRTHTHVIWYNRS